MSSFSCRFSLRKPRESSYFPQKQQVINHLRWTMHLIPAAVQPLRVLWQVKLLTIPVASFFHLQSSLHILSSSFHSLSSPIKYPNFMPDRVSQLVTPLAWHERLVSGTAFFSRSHMLSLNICCCLSFLMGPSETFFIPFLFPRHFHSIIVAITFAKTTAVL